MNIYRVMYNPGRINIQLEITFSPIFICAITIVPQLSFFYIIIFCVRCRSWSLFQNSG